MMKKDEFKSDVLFRKEKSGPFKGEIFAVFPYIVDCYGYCTFYQHIGQHSSGEYEYALTQSIPAKPEEYKDLFDELESIGYNLNIIKRRNYKKFTTELYNQNVEPNFLQI